MKLANAGNAQAQQQLGQMYWYGEAGAVDEAGVAEAVEAAEAMLAEGVNAVVLSPV